MITLQCKECKIEEGPVEILCIPEVGTICESCLAKLNALADKPKEAHPLLRDRSGSCDICRLNPDGKINLLYLLTDRGTKHCVAPGRGCKGCPNRCGRPAMYIGGLNICSHHFSVLRYRLREMQEPIMEPTEKSINAYADRDEIELDKREATGLMSWINEDASNPNGAQPHTWAELASAFFEGSLNVPYLLPIEKKTLTLYYFDGLSFQAIAKPLNMTAQGVRSKIRRARQKLEEHGCYTPRLDQQVGDPTMGGFWNPEEASVKYPVKRLTE